MTIRTLLAALCTLAFAALWTGCANEDRECEAGDSRLDDDGCNTCVCSDDGSWACTLMYCGGDAGGDTGACTDGATRLDDDGCNTCTCMDGGWSCTEMACVGECVTDADCVVSGCSGQLCAAEPMESDCAWRDEYACYHDEAITSCGCNDGVCGWAQTDALDACLADPPCSEGDTRPAGDGCNSCSCMEDGTWACTLLACEPECDPGDSVLAEDGCDCFCTDGGRWECALYDVDGDLCADDPTCEPGTTATIDDCNTCFCMEDGTWACTGLACSECEPGDTIDAENGCDCVCDDAGFWSCDELDFEGNACDGGATCVPGETLPAPDGCNTCTCLEDGSLACTDMACTGSCRTDADCIVTGCSGQICADTDIASTCEWLDEYACFADPAVTSCGCFDGACGWEQTDALASCLGR